MIIKARKVDIESYDTDVVQSSGHGIMARWCPKSTYVDGMHKPAIFGMPQPGARELEHGMTWSYPAEVFINDYEGYGLQRGKFKLGTDAEDRITRALDSFLDDELTKVCQISTYADFKACQYKSVAMLYFRSSDTLGNAKPYGRMDGEVSDMLITSFFSDMLQTHHLQDMLHIHRNREIYYSPNPMDRMNSDNMVVLTPMGAPDAGIPDGEPEATMTAQRFGIPFYPCGSKYLRG